MTKCVSRRFRFAQGQRVRYDQSQGVWVVRGRRYTELYECPSIAYLLGTEADPDPLADFWVSEGYLTPVEGL